MATEKRLIGNSFKCDNCIHTKACERLCAIFDWSFFDCEMRSVACKTYEPKVDAVEVVHGRWVGYHEADIGYDEYGVRCSNCNFEVEDHEVNFIMNYCPNCGAKMDGDGNA